jgi:hypothetical protein
VCELSREVNAFTHVTTSAQAETTAYVAPITILWTVQPLHTTTTTDRYQPEVISILDNITDIGLVPYFIKYNYR